MSIFDMFNNILHDDGAPEYTTEDVPFDIFHIVIEDEDEEDDYY